MVRRCQDLSRRNSPPPDDRSKFLVNIPRVGRLIPPRFRPDGIPKSFTRVSWTKKKEHLSVDPSRGQFWKADPEKARQKDAHVSARGDDRSRTRAYVCVCTLRRLRNARTSFILLRDLSHKVTAICASLSFFFFSYEREDCGNSGHVRAYTHAALVVRAREDGGNFCGVWKERPNVGGRRTDGGAKGGRTRQGWEDDRTYGVHGRHKAANPWEYRACASGPARGLHELYGLSCSLRVPLFFLKPPAALCTHGIPARARRFLFQHVAALRGRRHRRPFCPQQLAPASCPSRECKGHIVARESLFNWLKGRT